MKEYEYNTGKRLLRAINSNVGSQVLEAIESARKELLSSDRHKSHDQDFDNMVKKMSLYLTRKYDVGEGKLLGGGKTPLELAESLHANQAVAVINEQLSILARNKASIDVLGNAVPMRESPMLGKIDKDRAIQARERLKQFQKQRNESKK